MGDWSGVVPVGLPVGQVVVRERVNGTGGVVPEGVLHGGFFEWAGRFPGRVALVGDGVSVSYGELAGRALEVAGFLRGAGVGVGDAVGVVMPRGVDQVVAVLGVLAVGGVYVPVGVDQPVVRRERMLAGAGVVCVLTGVDVCWGAVPLAGPVGVSGGDLAYVIFTSGSTGEPKGV
ncbi:AMP-binding protein, partial [Sphaerisporangium melleum]|uniref:AMP-binding protein n=1 Tax=Sphaerisporangium melleum TaxID=321316 RepID=UPI0027E4AE58